MIECSRSTNAVFSDGSSVARLSLRSAPPAHASFCRSHLTSAAAYTRLEYTESIASQAG